MIARAAAWWRWAPSCGAVAGLRGEHGHCAGSSCDNGNETPDEAIGSLRLLEHQLAALEPGRGHHVARSVGEIVTIEAELWSHFGSSQAVNDALEARRDPRARDATAGERG